MQEFKGYEAADVKSNSSVAIKFQIKFMFILLKSILLSIPEFIKWFFPKQPKSIAGQLALVTGGSNGIGKAIAISLAKKGCNIAIANRNHQEGIATAKEIEEKYGVKAKAFKVDVSKKEDVAKLKADVEKSIGAVDILVNNAAYLTLKLSLLEGTDEEIQSVIDTNLTSYFWTTRAFLPGMIERKRGHIVAVSSIAAIFSIANSVTYSTTKAGNDNFMNALYDDLCWKGQDGFINLTTVYPGPVATQKSFQKVFDSLTTLPMFEPSYIGHMTVKGMLLNRRKFILPPSSGMLLAVNLLPDKIFKSLKLSLINPYNEGELKELRQSL